VKQVHPTDNLPSSALPVEREWAPKTYDIDYAGHVSNISYIRWLEDLRLAWLDEYAPLEEMMAEGIGPVLLRTEIDYLRPIRLHDRPVKGRLWVAEYDRLTSTLAAEFIVNGAVMARAWQHGMFFKIATGRPVRIPKQLVARLTEDESRDKV